MELTNRTCPSEAAHSLSEDTDIVSAEAPDATAAAFPPPVSVSEMLQLETTNEAVIYAILRISLRGEFQLRVTK